MNAEAPIASPLREPRQGRSRASFERMLAAAEKLMAERGSDEFTLNEVAKTGNLAWYRQHPDGGHFAALEKPQYFVQDMEDFVKEVWK